MWHSALSEALGEPGISEESRRVLQKQTIDENQPGTILCDFTTLVEFVGKEGLKTTGKYFMLPQGRLNELNERMNQPVKHRLKRPQQRSFPHLHGLFLILRASGMGIGNGAPPNSRLMIDEEMVANWLDLNPTEQYFTLLESWLVQGNVEILGERGGWSRGFTNQTFELSQKFTKRRTVISDKRHDYLLYGTMQLVTAALMELFGWIRLEYHDPKESEGVRPAAVERLPLGDAMTEVIFRWTLSEHFFSEQDAAEIGTLQPLFQPYFPEWQQNLVPPKEAFREGDHTWRVSLGKTWRRIVAPADSDLDDLAMAILDAFDFDDDHLYCFQLSDRRGRSLRIACPYEEDAPARTEEVRLGDVPLPVGGTMTFVFDYGDNWQFDVKLESVDSKKSKRKTPKVIAKDGKAPAQYDWEESEEWDEW